MAAASGGAASRSTVSALWRATSRGTRSIASNPNAKIKYGVGPSVGSGVSPAFAGAVDTVAIGVNGAETTYDFEPTCGDDCYVSPSGSDSNGGTSFADAKLTIQAGIDAVNAGGTVHVNDGTYAESPHVAKSLTLQAENPLTHASIIDLQQTGANNFFPYGALRIAGADVTVDGFTILGQDGTDDPGGTLAITNVLIDPGLDHVTISNNVIKVGLAASSSDGSDGIGVESTYAPSDDLVLDIIGNAFEPVTVGGSGTRAYYANPGVASLTVTGNTITGNFTSNHQTEATTALIEGNTVTGPATSGTLSAAGFSGPGASNTTFRNNTVTGVSAGFKVRDANNALIEHNLVSGTIDGVRVESLGTPGVDPSGIEIHDNSFSGLTGQLVTNAFAQAVDASGNWWGTTALSGANVTGLVDVTPWLDVSTRHRQPRFLR